jgi:hypothetical protein
MAADIVFGKETKDDGTWRADLWKEDGMWHFQRYKNSPLGWTEMGEVQSFYEKDVAIQTLYRLGFSRVA